MVSQRVVGQRLFWGQSLSYKTTLIVIGYNHNRRSIEGNTGAHLQQHSLDLSSPCRHARQHW
jgi:hypothetical protein